MTDAVELMNRLNSLDVRVWRDGDRIAYDAPDDVMTPALKRQLAKVRDDLLFLLDASEPVPLSDQAGKSDLILSCNQCDSLSLHYTSDSGVFNNISRAFHIRGQIDHGTIAEALAVVVERHKVLRTMYRRQGVGFAGTVLDPGPVELIRKDLCGHTGRQQQELLRLAFSDEASRRFEIDGELLLRAVLLTLSPASQVLILTSHSIAADCWSMGGAFQDLPQGSAFWDPGILFNELASVAGGFMDGTEPDLPRLTIQYSDFARWQRLRLDAGGFEQQRSWWSQYLRGLPKDFGLALTPVPEQQRYRGRRLPFLLSATLSDEVRGLSRRVAASMFNVLLAVYKILLYQATGRRDLIVGAPVAARVRAELKPLIGNFGNNLVLRTHLEKNLSFREWVQRVRSSAHAAYINLDLPFSEISKIAGGRSGDITALPCHARFVMHELSHDVPEFRHFRVEPVRIDHEIAKHPLSLVVSSGGRVLNCWCEYDRALFGAETIGKLIGHFKALLAAVVEDPEKPLSQLPVIDRLL